MELGVGRVEASLGRDRASLWIRPAAPQLKVDAAGAMGDQQAVAPSIETDQRLTARVHQAHAVGRGRPADQIRRQALYRNRARLAAFATARRAGTVEPGPSRRRSTARPR